VRGASNIFTNDNHLTAANAALNGKPYLNQIALRVNRRIQAIFIAG